MAYADATYYRSTYQGRACSDDTILGKWLSRASDDIDILNLGAIDTTELSTAALDYLKKATCAQAESYVINGEDSGGGAESVSLGAFSMKKSASDTDRGGVISDRAARYLVLSGCGFRGVCAR